MSRPVTRNSTGNLARVRVFDEDALPWTGLAYDAAGLQIWYTPLGGSPVQITLSIANWTERKHGWYEIAVPDAAYTGTAPLQFSGEITDGTVEADQHVIVGYDPLAEAVGANTIAPDNAGIAAAQLAAETSADLLGSMTGPNVRKLTFVAHTGEDPETGSPVLGVQIWIAGRVITTGTAGDAEIKLNPGTYNAVIISPIGFAVVADIEIVIGAEDVTVPIAMVSTGSAVTPPPGACAVTVPVVDQSGQPIEGVSVGAKLSDGYAVAADSMAINAADSMATDADGLVTLILLREQDYNLTAARDECSVTIKIRTPDAEAATLGQVVIG